MSITYSLFISLLCLSLNITHGARNQRLIDKQPRKRTHLSIKDEEKGTLQTIAVPLINANATMSNEDTPIRRNRDDHKDPNEKPKYIRPRLMESQHKSQGGLDLIMDGKVSGVKVRWRVPHKKRSVPQPDFNLDYAPPKVHPPSHN
ncbi:hypothetical protein Nepgr_002446 [Nepenthes gracilis]|uniref:Uncharacterized protein n=1 Tax=Nepenthes gracilis TaxID=150966 RepID=A0AAD3P9Z7_NEPGR|nr:hypothetical protein Nepgr_002446 [Nepenthes gracilis]